MNLSYFKNLYARGKYYLMYKYKPQYVQADELYFGQQHAGTINFFGERYHTVHIKDFPQVAYLKGNKKVYTDYLKHSFSYTRPQKNVEVEIEKQTEKFEKLIEDSNNVVFNEPIQYTKRFDGKKLF